jgi:glutamyl-Q tRNA(Asp) synthetase
VYVGRFAPSPTGPLHAGSLVAALASWLDARAHGGPHHSSWLVRIEDVDTPRCVPGADQLILKQLADCGLHPDQPPVWQSQRTNLYQQALGGLVAQKLAYPCCCSRKDIETELQRLDRDKPRHGELIYPGTCRSGLQGKQRRAWRLWADGMVHWSDRRLGPQQQDVAHEVGDFVLQRADGLMAYQLAVVVDDAAQGVTHVVRGEDLADNTARQIVLQKALDLPTPIYLHTPLVLGGNGEKLSKQNGATPIDTRDPLQALDAAASVLGLKVEAGSLSEWLLAATSQWTSHYNRAP